MPDDARPTPGVTLPQRQVVLEAADYLLRVMAPEMSRSAEGLLDSEGVCVFEAGCTGLAAIGVFAPTDHPALWSQTLSLPELRKHLAARPLLEASQFDAVLQAFVDHAAGHTRSLPDTRAGFVLPVPFERIGAALLRAGYLEPDGHRVIWTEMIAPYMQQAILWDSGGHCLAEIWIAQEEAEARQFLADLPPWLREGLQGVVTRQSGLAGIDFLRRHRGAAGWSQVRQARPGDLTGTGFRVDLFTTVVRLMREGRA